MELRPLDLAGIFVRAATIYARNARVCIAVVVTALVPSTILQYFVTLKEEPQLDATIAWLQSPQNHQTGLPPMFGSPAILLLALTSFVAGYLIVALAVAAAGAGVAAQNHSEKPSYIACVMTAAHRWPAIAGVVMLILLLGLAVVIAVTGTILVPLAAIVALAPNAGPAVSAFGLLVMLVACGLLLALLFVVGAAAIYAATLEGAAPSEAIGLTVRRICNRAEIGRALMCACLVSGIVIAVTGSADVLSFALLPHQPAAYFGLDALARAFAVPFAAVAFAVYYFDLRVRQEGYDLQVRVDRVAAGMGGDGRFAPTRYLSGEERALVAAFIERRQTLYRPYRRDIAARIVAPVRMRVPQELAAMDDEALLERL